MFDVKCTINVYHLLYGLINLYSLHLWVKEPGGCALPVDLDVSLTLRYSKEGIIGHTCAPHSSQDWMGERSPQAVQGGDSDFTWTRRRMCIFYRQILKSDCTSSSYLEFLTLKSTESTYFLMCFLDQYTCMSLHFPSFFPCKDDDIFDNDLPVEPLEVSFFWRANFCQAFEVRNHQTFVGRGARWRAWSIWRWDHTSWAGYVSSSLISLPFEIQRAGRQDLNQSMAWT